MNRLVIIGNGFDLAHGLPTSYRDFIDDFWINFKDKCKTGEYKQLITSNDAFNGYYSNYKKIENFNDFKKNLFEYCKEYKYRFVENSIIAQHNTIDIFRFNNVFFRDICFKNSENWVDIENEYYRQLKECLKNEKSIIELNREFDEIKTLLEKYLINSIENGYDFSDNDNNWAKFYEILKPISIYNHESNLLDEFKDRSDKGELKRIINSQRNNPEENKKSTLCLNFNYTTTINKYLENLKKGEVNIDNIHIHGELLNEKDQINFGFGDEMDDAYKAIENINDNEYLRNFKSFQYLQNNNYDKLLNYIDSDKYQVIILGHSCGLSDRTLLNTIFEHENCRSIKPYYYEIINEESKVIGDNYTEIVQNISRHFNKKKLMREKIVNKTLCKPLPQIQLPKK